jgi:dTDP-4-amino-4,6-dideoxygalactose transaminase
LHRIHLSPPDVGPHERALLLDAFDSNWVAPVGPHVDAFETEIADLVGVADAAAMSSGTDALHLALLVLDVSPGDDVFLPALTFVATANAVSYTGATPVFVDSEPDTWNIDPVLLDRAISTRIEQGHVPGAVVVVDLYGQCADYEALSRVCDRHGVPLIEDAAEALGATWGGRPAGSFGRCAVLSFNGNKIITTGGGGMFVSDDKQLVARARFLSTQAREPTVHYEHREVGFNHRMCNLNAAVGRGQLRGLTQKVLRRRAIKAFYREQLGHLPGIAFMPDDPRGEPSNWLTVITLDPERGTPPPEVVREALEAADIEARPAWKPMHLQPLYADAPVFGGAVAEQVFSTGLCLPSGSGLTDDDLQRIVDVVRSVPWPR